MTVSLSETLIVHVVRLSFLSCALASVSREMLIRLYEVHVMTFAIGKQRSKPYQ